MAQAWLDSLSEDWVSQPRSDPRSDISLEQSQSQSQSPSRPNTSTTSANGRSPRVSRIPRFNPANVSATKKVHPSAHNSSSIQILSERTMNDINIRKSQPGPSKLIQESRSSQQGRHPSRSASASTTASVVHNTVQQNKSQSSSPSKTRENVPEWKRRLIYGELNYGESKDLFSSAGTGLENIFRPPMAQEPTEDETIENREVGINDTTLPSSPPPYLRRIHETRQDESFEPSANESLMPRSPSRKKFLFRRTEADADQSSRIQSRLPSNEYRHGQGKETNGLGERSAMSLNCNSGLDESRKVSGQSVVRNEDLSPILLSRHNSGDGKVSFAPVELPAEQLRKRLENLRQNQMVLDSEPESYLTPEPAITTDGTPKVDSTDEFVKNGGYLNTRRGGRSAEGSFRQRPLSPPLNTDTSEMLPESSLQASTPKQFPTVRVQRVASADRIEDPETPLNLKVPRAPHPSPEKRIPEKRIQPSSSQGGSPLKLFGPYDTFTNQTLLRRISQFEDQMTEDPSRSRLDDTIASPMESSPSKSETNKSFITESTPRKAARADFDYPDHLENVSFFGAGELDGYEFNEEITQNSIDYSQFTNKENMAPADDSLRPTHFIKFPFYQGLSFQENPPFVQRRRHKPSGSSFSHRRSMGLTRFSGSTRAHSSTHPNGLNGGFEFITKRESSDGKRPRTSPSKDPTPKRRRTLHRSDIAYGLEDQVVGIESVQSSHRTMQSVIARKRQLSNQNQLQDANSRYLATRQVLRPRSPTPSHRLSIAHERYPLANLHYDPDHQNGESDTSGQDFAVDGSGRTSMKTQDFFDAAEEIMAMIRNKARPRNDLSSVEESEAESAEQRSSTPRGGNESSFQESTKEPFSRPPSREGPPILNIPTRQEDPELVDRLRQYEERSDLGEIISNSMNSMGQIREAIHKANSLSESLRQSVRSSKTWDDSPEEQDVVSDLSNVRISRNPDFHDPVEDTMEYPTNGTRSSEGSTNHSFPTASSQRSDSRKLIVPDVVTPLIGNQVGNMVFDKETNRWYKVKEPRPTSRGGNILPSEDSEDPFASIPDLSVDIDRETENLAIPTRQNSVENEQSMEEGVRQGPSSKPSAVVLDFMEVRNMMSQTKGRFKRMRQTMTETAVEDDEEIEHEISIHEDRMQQSTSPSRRRNLTISFSSPIASVIQDTTHQSDEDNIGQEPDLPMESVEQAEYEPPRRGRQSKPSRSAGKSTTKPTTKPRSRSRSRKNLSAKGREFVPRPVSRIDEQDEDLTGEQSASEQQISLRGESSLICAEDDDKCNNTSLSVVVTTPSPVNHAATPIIGQYVGTLSLSPLSDFTMHQADQSCGLEVSYVVGDRYLATGDGSKKIMSKAIQNLVEKITEVEPFEPDWECMDELDINNKQLTTLHMLDEFCTGVVTLNASNNSIEHLDGVPECVRNLRITHNHLSELTAWGHLMNLQYVDVSHNQIGSLNAFKDLVHLRSLRADHNQITSLDGIKMHDSLQVLRARGNLLRDVNLDGTKMQRLTELDLENNQISSIHGIEQLSCLVTLNLQNNDLPSFGPSMDVPISNLKYLNLSNNDLTTVDMSLFPSLRLLHADRNQIVSLTGFSRCRRLDSLSLREQRGDTPLDASFLNAAFEVRKLFLSGNLLASFEPSVDFLNLQLLELANCGLERLPADLGQLMPNLRVLNLNMNALEDVSALRFIPRLKKLLLAGNRLANPADVADTLAGFPHLARLDLRDNPATQGFYAPVQALVSTDANGKGGIDPFVLPDADPERDAQFASRSDMGTRMRRRFFEMVVRDRCPRVKMLDGLPVSAGGGPTKKRDKVWDALVKTGVVQDLETGIEAQMEAVEIDGDEKKKKKDDKRKMKNKNQKKKRGVELEELKEEEEEMEQWQ